VRDPLIGIHQVVAIHVLWPELHLALFNDGRDYAAKHAIGNEFAHTLARPEPITPHIVSGLRIVSKSYSSHGMAWCYVPELA
jgi:hypothetical protein